MTDNTENPITENFEDSENQITENFENVFVGTYEQQEILPWENAPENVYYYSEINEEGVLFDITESAELAYTLGYFDNQISKDDVQVSDINNWHYLKSKCPMKGLTEKKQDKLREISNYADRYEQNKCDEMYVISSLGFRANADRRSLQNVENLIRLGQETVFKDYDNQFHSVSIQDLETLLMEISANGSNLYNQKFQMQFRVQNITTLQELENFEVQFEMMDFTENN